MTAAPYRDAELLPVDLDIRRQDDGEIRIASRVRLAEHDWNMARAFAGIAARRPDAPALHRREGGVGDWRTVTYGELKRLCDSAGQWLIDRRARAGGGEGPVLILGPNSPVMAAWLFGSMAAGAPSAPVSPMLALVGGDLGRLKHVLGLLKPSVVVVEDARPFAAALETLDIGDAVLVTATPEALARPAVAMDQVLATPVTSAVADGIEARRPDDTAQFLLTSGSTGLPKAVPISMRNVAANTASGRQVTRLNWTDRVLNWMPWHHAAGASVLRACLLSGGEFYIDDGKPLPGLFDMSIRNLKEIPVRYYVNVPLGYALLADALEADADLRRMFFSELKLMLFGGAALSQPVNDRIQRMAVEETGHRILMISAYGATETTSGVLAVHDYEDQVGLGLPLPGTTVKLVPYDHRYEIRLSGPSVAGGYHEDPERTAAAFDAEGFYRTGDLATFVDPARPERGLVFAGRMAEEFKLATGAWVSGGAVREAALKALSPLVAEVVPCDDNRPWLGLLAWPSPEGVERTLGRPLDEALASGALTATLKERLDAYNADQKGLSTRVRRLGLLTTPPNPNAHEVSDKGTINRRAVLDNRTEAVDGLYADPPAPGVIEAA